MPMPPSLPASSPAAQSASNAPGSGTPGGSMGPGSASGAGPLPNMSPSTTSTQSNAYPHCPPIRTNSPSPAPSLTPQPRQTPPPTIPRSQTPQPQTPSTPQQPPQPQASQQQLLGQTGTSEKASQLPQQTLGAAAASGHQAGPASSVPSQNAHVPLQLPQTPVSTFLYFLYLSRNSFLYLLLFERIQTSPTETCKISEDGGTNIDNHLFYLRFFNKLYNCCRFSPFVHDLTLSNHLCTTDISKAFPDSRWSGVLSKLGQQLYSA